MGNDPWQQFVGHPVGREDLDLIRTVVADFVGLSREELAATVCEWLGWTRPTGRVTARECRAWLERLETAGLITLPPKRVGRPVGARTAVPNEKEYSAWRDRRMSPHGRPIRPRQSVPAYRRTTSPQV